MGEYKVVVNNYDQSEVLVAEAVAEAVSEGLEVEASVVAAPAEVGKLKTKYITYFKLNSLPTACGQIQNSESQIPNSKFPNTYLHFY